MLHLIAAYGAGLGGQVTLTGESVSDEAIDPANATAVLRIDADGNVYAVEGGVQRQLTSSTNWLRPAAGAPGPYQVRYTGRTGDDPTGATEDEWVELSSGSFSVQLIQATTGSKACSFDIEIRAGTGPVLATGSYSLSVIVV